MGILDSNKMNMLAKSGEFSCNLASDSPQNHINLNGAEYNTLKVNITDIPAQADIIIVINGAVVSNAYQLPIYDSNGNKINHITSNGIYYIDISGITSIYFGVNRRIESGSATVKYIFSTKPINTFFDYILNIQNSLGSLTDQEVISASETLDLSTTGNKKELAASLEYECLAIHVSALSAEGVFGVTSSKTYGYLQLYDLNGNVYKYIKSTGFYFVPIRQIYGNLFLRVPENSAVSEGSATVSLSYMKAFPQEVLSIKPIQRLVSKTVNVPSTSLFIVVDSNELKDISLFKFYFVSYIFKNNSSSVDRNAQVTVQPYFINNTVSGNSEEICVSDTYSMQSTWKEVVAESGLRIYLKVTDRVEGDSVIFNVYGVR